MRPVNRRTVLHAMAVAGMVLPKASLAERAEDRQKEADVVVIGGGFAGLVAAREIQNAGLSALVLEARSRLGGRTFTASAFGHSLDLGGTWIGPQQPHVWAECTRYGLDLVESAIAAAPKSVAIWLRHGKLVRTSPEELDGIAEPAIERWLAEATDVFKYPWQAELPANHTHLDQQSVAESIARQRVSADIKTLLANYACDEGHTYTKDMSYVSMLHGMALVRGSLPIAEDNTDRFRIAGGTKALLDAVISDARPRVRLSAKVERVEARSGRFMTSTDDGKIVKSKAVVVAVPLNTLAGIQFDPPLSDGKLAAVQKRFAGTGLKVYVRIRGGQLPFSAQGEEAWPLSSVWTEYEDAEGQVLVGFGADSKRLNVHDIDAVTEAVKVYNRRLEVSDVLGYDWQSDPYARGTWCSLRPGQFSTEIPALRRPTNGLFFAGSDLARSWQGSIDGAIETGIRSGREAARHASAS